MRRQFSSWTSNLGRYSQLNSASPTSWSGLTAARGSRTGVFRSGWIWTGLILIVLLVGSMALLSVFSTAPTPVGVVSTPIPSGDGSEPIVAPYDADLGLAREQPWGRLILDMVVKLGLVIVLIGGVLWLLRRFQSRIGKVLGSETPGGSFQVLDRAQLGPGHTIYTVDLGSRILVIGATASEVTLLTEVDGPEDMLDLRRRSGVSDVDFDQVMAEAENVEAETRGSGEAPFRHVTDRLRSLVRSAPESAGSASSRASTTSN